MNTKVISVTSSEIKFDNGLELYSEHNQDCCENHYLHFDDLTLSDFDGLEFDLSGDEFFKKVEDYGILLIPIKGHGIGIPGYGYNNGYYSTDLTLVLSDGREFDISECQEIKY